MYTKIRCAVLTRDPHNSIGSNTDVALDNMLFRSGIVSLLLLLLLLLSSDVFGIGVGVSLIGRIRRCLFGGSQRTRAIEGLSLKEKKKQARFSSFGKHSTFIYQMFFFQSLSLCLPLSLSLLNIKHCIFIK